MEEDEDGTLSVQQAYRAELIDPTIAAHRGQIGFPYGTAGSPPRNLGILLLSAPSPSPNVPGMYTRPWVVTLGFKPSS